ncbi:MAG: carboxypeptidase-like regulatory domain-containing protein [Fermentimonas sp.]
MKYLVTLSLVFCCILSANAWAVGETVGVMEAGHRTDSIHVLRGRVLGGDTNEPLVNASITVSRTHISSVTNQEGYFSIRVPASSRHSHLVIRHLGYENGHIPVITLIDAPNNHIKLKPSPFSLSEVEVVSGDGTQLVREALRRISQNYSHTPNMMVSFYRESVKKGSRYISLVEAVLDIYKASYSSFSSDQARIYIGRKATDISPRDTVLLKFQGGISDALLLDIAKNPDIVFDTDGSDYSFHIDGLINYNDRPHYAISFAPLESVRDILFRGTIYLEAHSLAFARMEFNMNVEGRKDASHIFIRRKPPKMKVEVNRAHYVVDFSESEGKWFFNYSSIDVEFRVRWSNRLFGLFATHYTIGSEMAITDRYNENVVRFPRDERIRSTDVIAEKVEYFLDPDFWGEYNVIEPDQEITDAIRRLSGKLKRRQ